MQMLSKTIKRKFLDIFCLYTLWNKRK